MVDWNHCCVDVDVSDADVKVVRTGLAVVVAIYHD
jgi:hypothetical protein